MMINLLDEKLCAFVLDVSFCGGEKRTNSVDSYTTPGLGNQAMFCYTYYRTPCQGSILSLLIEHAISLNEARAGTFELIETIVIRSIHQT